MNVPVGRYWALLVTYLRPQRGRFALLVALLLGGIGLQLVIPQITRYFIDAARGGAVETLTAAALGFIGLALVQQGAALATAYVSENVAWTATNGLRADLVRHLLRLDMRFHNERTVGELIERADGDVTELADFFSRLVIVVFGNLLLVAGIVVILAREDLRLGLAFTVFCLLALGALASVRNLAIPAEKARRQANADLFGYLEERLAAAEDIRSSGAVPVMLNGLVRLQAVIQARGYDAILREWGIQIVTGMVVTLGYALAFVTGYTLFQSGLISLGTAYLILNYAILLNRPFQELTAQIDRLQRIGASIERIEELLRSEPQVRDGAGAALPAGAMSLTFENVTFGYGDEVVLREVNFRLAAGQVLGLLGRTGSGKTTLSRLAVRFYDADSGRIELGGLDVRDRVLADLRQRVGLVTQDVQLFEASLRDNLTFFDPAITDAQLNEALAALGLSDWLAVLPGGLDARIASGGRNLSAGEAQLLAFARVFLRDPGLVILDEASARLDPATEARIDRAVENLLRDRTGIIIAHRLRTVQRADAILILDGGRIVEYGQREALAADTGSHFYQLLQTGLEEVLS